jgi:AraC-like DNA-binding protein
VVLYVLNVSEEVAAWRPDVPGIAEVFHAHFVDHAYPMHTHDTWTLLIVDDGGIRYGLDHNEHGALRASVTLLPPGVAHDGRAATRHGFRKRVIYLDLTVLSEDRVGAAVAEPSLSDEILRDRIHRLHLALASPGNEFEAESRLTLIRERLDEHLRPQVVRPSGVSSRIADRLRDLLDARTTDGLTMRDAADVLHTHPAHLVRSFTAAYGLPPHAYLIGRRIDHARRLLLTGLPPVEVASAAGFYDQSHLTRHFRRYLGTAPSRYASRSR